MEREAGHAVLIPPGHRTVIVDILGEGPERCPRKIECGEGKGGGVAAADIKRPTNATTAASSFVMTHPCVKLVRRLMWNGAGYLRPIGDRVTIHRSTAMPRCAK